jgi:hypothetical protein
MPHRARHRQAPGERRNDQIAMTKRETTDDLSPALVIGHWDLVIRSTSVIFGANRHGSLYRSISPMTISNDPTMAGTSAIRHPWHSSVVTDKLQNELLRARARQGIAEPSLTI